MKRSVLLAVLALLLACACLASAEPEKINLIMIGGDGDLIESSNNIFRNILLSHEELQDRMEAFFVRSVKGRYDNATAIKQKNEMLGYISPDRRNIVAGFSHGGQSVYFLETDHVSDIFLMDACVSIGGKCAEPVSCGKVWAQWIIDTAKKGIDLHIFASRGKHNEPSGAKNAIVNLEKIAEEDNSVEALEAGLYRVLDESGNELARIEASILEINHREICPAVQELAERFILALPEE